MLPGRRWLVHFVKLPLICLSASSPLPAMEGRAAVRPRALIALLSHGLAQ